MLYTYEDFEDHKLEANESGDGWDWACTCGMHGHSADRREHWIELIMDSMEETKREIGDRPATPERKALWRELILAGLLKYA